MKPTVKETALFSLLGALMLVSKLVLEFLPNVHMLATLTIAYTICFRKKALYPIYVYVFLNGLVSGFNLWWLPYLYLWTILWGVTMLLPKNMKSKLAVLVYMAVAGLHGLLFGTMYAPAQAVMFGLDFKGAVAWIIAGLPWDLVHGISNFFMALLVIPIVRVIKLAQKYAH